MRTCLPPVAATTTSAGSDPSVVTDCRKPVLHPHLGHRHAAEEPDAEVGERLGGKRWDADRGYGRAVVREARRPSPRDPPWPASQRSRRRSGRRRRPPRAAGRPAARRRAASSHRAWRSRARASSPGILGGRYESPVASTTASATTSTSPSAERPRGQVGLVDHRVQPIDPQVVQALRVGEQRELALRERALRERRPVDRAARARSAAAGSRVCASRAAHA